LAGSYFIDMQMPSAAPVVASALPAARINVTEALRSD
jgi:hypothetical protein